MGPAGHRGRGRPDRSSWRAPRRACRPAPPRRRARPPPTVHGGHSRVFTRPGTGALAITMIGMPATVRTSRRPTRLDRAYESLNNAGHRRSRPPRPYARRRARGAHPRARGRRRRHGGRGGRPLPDAARASASRSSATARPRSSEPCSDPPHLLVLDLMLPGIDGLEVCRRLRALAPVPVIMLTARGDEADRVIGLELGRRRLRGQALLTQGAHPAGQGGAAPSEQPPGRGRRAPPAADGRTGRGRCRIA